MVGTAAAYYLSRDGHDVEVLEAHGQLATEASGANACLVAPGHSFAWASPAAPRMLIDSLRGSDTAIRMKPVADPQLLAWGLRFLRECTGARARRNTLVKLRLCQYSRGALEGILAEEDIELGRLERGLLFLYRDQLALEAGAERMTLLQEHGEEQKVLDADGCREREPALAEAPCEFAGAVHGINDFSGDCHRFTEELASRCIERGVKFHFGAAVHGFETSGSDVTGAVTDGRVVHADAFVMAAGVSSAKLSRALGERIAVYPAKGYSATFPITESSRPPAMGGVDEATLVAWSNLGDRLRMSATAEFSGYGRGWRESDFANIRRTAQELFPGAADYDDGEYRACLRPMTPDGPPLIGRGKRRRNLWFNTGHGHLGWTMACGSGKLLRDLLAGRSPEISLQGMEPRR